MIQRLAVLIGILLAIWMTVGHWAFGLGGPLTWWYVIIGAAYIAIHLWVAYRIRLARDRGLRRGRSTVVALILSWTSAVGFGFTVPDLVNGELMSIVSHYAGSAFSAEMSIALCNPFGILAFALLFAALGFSIADGREPRPEEDEGDDEQQMAPHPLG
ncbi:hypothetical protein [Leucobacter sp. GX24907]